MPRSGPVRRDRGLDLVSGHDQSGAAHRPGPDGHGAEDVPADQQQFIKLNVELSRKWPSITKTKAALADADQWKDVAQKTQFLER